MLNDIYISIYSYGYSAGFIKDSRRKENFPFITPRNLIEICHDHSFCGVELPIDKYIPEYDSKKIQSLLNQYYKNNLGVKIDFERISSSYTKKIIPIMLDYKIEYFRVKVSNIFGCNRYKHPEFYSHFNNFIIYLREILPYLEKNNIKILIENHQDILIDDYFKIWDEFSNDLIGVNWDVGNSIPALATPDDFLERVYPYIGNIHLKDYKIYKTDLGYKLVRCPLGKGAVNFDYIFSFLNKKQLNIPMTIELGAMSARHSDIYVDAFWEALPEISEKRRKAFINYINENYTFDKNDKTTWEKGYMPEKILKSEVRDVVQSSNFLKNFPRSSQKMSIS